MIADRHLASSTPAAPELAARHRWFVADRLGPLNPTLAIGQFAGLRGWLAQYELVVETPGARVYRWRAAS